MSINSVSMAAPFNWFMKALDVGRRQPKALFGGFVLLILVGAVPSVLQVAGKELLGEGSSALLVVYGVSVVLSLLLMPPLMGSAFRLVHACENGTPSAATDIFAGLRDRDFVVRTLLAMLVAVAAYVLLIGVLVALLPGKEFFAALAPRLLDLQPGETPDLTGLPPFPSSFLLWLLAAMAVTMVMQYAYMLGFARVALNGRGPLAAFGDGLKATLRNVLPFVAFTFAAVVVGSVALLLLALVAGVLVAVLSAVSPALGIAAAIPLYLGAMLLFYVLSFGFHYHAWREMFSEPVAAPEDALEA
jgi:hypothetical protein